MMNKEKFDKIIQSLMNKEIEINHLLNHLNQTQLETSFQLTNGSPTIEDKPIENVLLDKEINHDFILYFMNLVHAEGNHFLPIRPNPQNVMSPNKNILNLSHFSNAAEMTGSIAASLATTAITTPTTEPKRLYPRSIKHQANNSPRANVFQNSFESHSSVCSTPRQFNNGNTGGGGGTRLTRNYSSLSCQSSPGIDYSPRNNQSYTGGRNQHPVRHTLFDYIASPVKSPNENSRGIISPLAHPQPQHPAPTGQTSESFSSRLREVSSGVVFSNNVTAWPTVMSSRGSSSKFNTPVKSTTTSAMIKSSNEEELKVAPNNENIVEMDFEVENKEAVAKELCFECVEKSLEKNDIQRLSILAHFYSQLILRNLTLTVNTELFFLFQLITLNPNENKLGNHPDDLKLFNSIEFCIYFAIKSIVYLESVLKHLKNSTLVELTENIHMKNFLNELQTLSKSNSYHLAPQEIKQKSKMVFLELKVVPFNAETSTIGNYQDKNSFVSFKNQRDEFYDILWKWETNHKLETWSFYEECGKRIRGLIWENKNTANFLLFIKLFVDQLVLMCKDDKLLIDNKNEELLGMESSRLKLDDPLKIKKLNARMITPNTHYGPIPEPKFIGYQEFFKDFIDLSTCPAFHQCLKDFISNEIESIHKEIPELENDDENENAIDKEMLEDMMLKLRVLGKFLGYLHFQPYHHIIGNINSSLDMVSIRNNKMIPLNLESYIQRAIAKSHLIMTIPFIIEFLSMMDENALLIDSIHASISLLNVIYNSKFMSLSSTEFTRDKFLLLLNISWLFQLKKIDHNQLKPKQITLNEETKRGLDSVSFVTPLVLHFCCPYLDELQRLLTKFSSGVKKGCQKIRELSHLHPLQMKKENLMDTALDKNQIQIQLINQFLFLRPSHRRLIEFASDLVVKNFLKQYRINKPANDNSSIDSQKSNKNKYKLECIAAGKEYFGPKIETLIDSSLCESECALVVEKSKQICMYKSVEKLKAWINSHLKSDSEKPGSNNQEVDILENYFTQMPNNTVSENIQIKNILLGSSSKSTSDIYKDIKEAAKIIVSKSREFSEIENTINKLIDDILEYFSTNKNSESKLLRPIKEYIGQMLCEIIMYYVLNNHQQPVKTETVENCFDLIRMLFSGSEKLKEMFHCSRNSYLLQNKINSSVLTDNYEILIKIGGNEIDLRKK